MNELLVDSRWTGPHGIGRFAREVIGRLPGAQTLPPGLPLLHPLEPFWLSRTIARIAPSVYFSPGFNPPWSSRVPFVFTIHDLIHVEFPEESGFGRRCYYRFVVRRGASRAFRVLTGSQFSRGRILEWSRLPEEAVVAVGYGVSPEFRPDGPRHQPGYPYLLYVGNRKAHKNLPRLLKGFQRSGLQREVKLVLSGPEDPKTSREAAGLDLNGRVEFAGELTEEELAALYRGALALAIPSLYEGFGMPALEAMACGTPVVAANATSLPEVVGEAAILVAPEEVDSIAAGLNRIVESPDLAAQLRQKGLGRASQFSWDRTAERVRTVLREAGGRLEP